MDGVFHMSFQFGCQSLLLDPHVRTNPRVRLVPRLLGEALSSPLQSGWDQ